MADSLRKRRRGRTWRARILRERRRQDVVDQERRPLGHPTTHARCGALAARLSPSALAQVDAAITEALAGSSSALEKVERLLPIARHRLRARLKSEPDAAGAPALRLLTGDLMADMELRLCIFVECEKGPTKPVTCQGSIDAESLDYYYQGCCNSGTAPFVSVDLYCDANDDGSAFVFMRVDRGYADICTPYTIEYHF